MRNYESNMKEIIMLQKNKNNNLLLQYKRKVSRH